MSTSEYKMVKGSLFVDGVMATPLRDEEYDVMGQNVRPFSIGDVVLLIETNTSDWGKEITSRVAKKTRSPYLPKIEKIGSLTPDWGGDDMMIWQAERLYHGHEVNKWGKSVKLANRLSDIGCINILYCGEVSHKMIEGVKGVLDAIVEELECEEAIGARSVIVSLMEEALELSTNYDTIMLDFQTRNMMWRVGEGGSVARPTLVLNDVIYTA